MNNRTDLEKNLYKESNKERKIFALSNEQIDKLITKVRTLNDCTVKYIRITNKCSCDGHFLKEGFYSNECKKALQKSYKQANSIRKKCNDYGAFLVNECQFSLVQELENNKDLLQDRLKVIEKEQYCLLRKLKSYKPTMDIRENISFISFYCVDVPFLISLTRKYFYKNKMPHFYTVMFKLGESLYEMAQEIVDMYAEWEEESERGC